MAFTYTVDGQTVFGDKRIHYGSATSTLGDVGGDIVTGLLQIHNMWITAWGAAIVAGAPTINATFPLASGTVSIIQTATTKAYWVAIGS